METVAGEKPLACATSLIVTAWFFPLCRFTGIAASAAIIILPESSNMQRVRLAAGTSFRRRLKGQLLAEAARFPHAKGDTRDHPDRTNNLRRPAQVQPQPEANQKSQDGRNQVAKFLFLRANVIAHERRCVDSHKRDQCSKIQHLRAKSIGKKECPDQHNSTYEENIVSWHAMPFVHGAEKRFRQCVAPPHAIEQTRGTQLRSHARTKIRQQQREPNHCE